MSRPPPDPATPGPALDKGALAQLRELDPDGRHGVIVRVLTAYETSLVRHLEQLRAELAAPSAKVVGGVAHTLKSSSASVGALALSRACAALERLLREDATAQTHDVAELIALGEAALAAVRTILRG
jgi:HPt (histidine-containing phosphotransfer) domain-containing protein